MEGNSLITYKTAAETIMVAILQGQYEAAKGVNRIQLTVYFGIGKYISLNTRKGVWGMGALDSISQILRKELPGPKGYSPSSLKNMRKFYENWIVLDPNPSVVTDEYINSTFENAEIQDVKNQCVSNLVTTISELKDYKIDVYQTIRILETRDFPVGDFFGIPFYGCGHLYYNK